MTEKQKIEVGQVWRVRAGNNYGTVVGVSPAWIKLDDDVDVRSFRRGDFLENWVTVDEAIAEVKTPADPDFAEVANADEHACMKAAIVAFNAQTGLKIDESHGWLLLVNMHITSNCMGFDIEAYGRDMHDLYEESRK